MAQAVRADLRLVEDGDDRNEEPRSAKSFEDLIGAH
jgi:hypothetical protein